MTATKQPQAYFEIKDTNIDGLGKVPAHWELKRLKHMAQVRLSNVDKHTVEGQQPVSLCNYVDVYKNELISSKIDFMQATATDEQVKKLSIQRGDVIITKDSESPSDIGVSAFAIEDIPSLVCGYHLALIRPDASDGSFLHYLFQSSYVRSRFEVESTGITRYALGKYSIENLPIAFPPLSEQQSISAFLDQKIVLFDNLIDKKERMMKLLLEKRQATITQAITKGLDSYIEMDDSGVEWIGTKPKHWKTVRLKFIKDKPFMYGANESADCDNPDFPRYVRITDINDKGSLHADTFKSLPPELAEPYLLQDGDLLFARSGATVGKTFLYSPEFGKCCYAGYLIKFSADRSKVLPKFVKYFAESSIYENFISLYTIQATIQNVSAEKYGNLSILLPSIKEQKEILCYLDNVSNSIFNVIAKLQIQVNKLKEYRQSIIYKAVTGKMKIIEKEN